MNLAYTADTRINSKITVAIIDDHELVRLGLACTINSDHEFLVVSQSHDAQSGLEQILSHRPDVVIVDIGMPGRNVFEMIKEAKQQLPMLRVIFLTAFSNQANIDLALAAGASGFVAKAESLTSISVAIRAAVLGQFIYLSPSIQARNEFESADSSLGEARVTSKRVGPGTEKAQGTKHDILSTRELEILRYVASGQSAKTIASHLTISAKTVDRHKANIMAKLNLHNQVDLTRFAIREGIVAP